MPTPTKLATIMPMSESRMMRVMILVLRKRCSLICSNIVVFLHFDISHADSLTDLIRLIEQVRSTPRKKRGIYWTKVSIDTLVLVGMRAVFSERKRKSKVLQILESRTDSFCFHEHARCYHRPQIRTNRVDNLRVSGASSSRGASTG